MKKMIILLAMVSILLLGCASAIRTSCSIYPEFGIEQFATVGATMIEKEVCGSREEWHGLAGGGMVSVSECGSSELIYLG